MTIAANSISRTGKNVIKTLAKNHQNNLESDCTDKIKNLTQNFQDEKDKNHYWSAPNFLYSIGTPMYDQDKLLLSRLSLYLFN
ncbi:MAG: hypothetical protein QNJ32_15745 [Xenococcaceae cyanobacterium MO_167.B27]|nr:hypothetical protein [Xenococcaceae cyanobacterium MO_167.B27]